VTTETEACNPTSTGDSPWRSVGVVVALTAGLSGIFWALINLTQTVTATYVFALMWMPAVAALLTCRIVGRPLSSLGLGRWNAKFALIAYLIPIAYWARVLPFTGVALVSGLIWAAWHYPSGCPSWWPRSWRRRSGSNAAY
jgi:hypothetical protein